MNEFLSATAQSVRPEWDAWLGVRAQPEILSLIEQSDLPEFKLQTLLRKSYPEQVVRCALTLSDCRRRAVTKYSLASRMWFDRQGLEQGTHEAVARYKAQRFSGEVWDLCTGIGADAAALARHATVISLDRDPLHSLMAKWNASEWGVSPEFLCADVLEWDFSGKLIHIDPDRRASTLGRSLRIEDYLPGLDTLQAMTRSARGGAIKLGPASNFGGKFPDAEVELISWQGECKEATVWFGELTGEAPFRATLLPSGVTLTGNPLDEFTEVVPPGRYLFDPDPAIVRAGLVDRMAREFQLSRLDAAEEYLTGDVAVRTPFAQPFEILANLPNHSRQIRDYFRHSKIGTLEIKCRHVPTKVDELRRQLDLPGDEAGVLFIARLNGKTRAVIARRVPAV